MSAWEQEVPRSPQAVVVLSVVKLIELWRSGGVQRRVVVLERGGAVAVEGVQGEGQGLGVLEEAQMRQAQQAGQGVQVVVVDDGGTQGVEGVQGEG